MAPHSDDDVVIYPISQATSATFADLYFRRTFLFFIQNGSKHVETQTRGTVVGETGDLMIFPPGSQVTLENRPVLGQDYRALGVCFTHNMIDTVFGDVPASPHSRGIQIVRSAQHAPAGLLDLIQTTVEDQTLPQPIRHHRLMEPLIWLRAQGISLAAHVQDDPVSQVRHLIETDLTHTWKAQDIAAHFAMSEATMRRWLARTGQGFARILLHTRLEHGLTQLQTTTTPISEIALNCGFKTPSHFSDAFRKRFGIAPKAIRKVID